MLLNKLHRPLFWVGEHIPEEIDINGKNVKLHEIIWEIINKTKHVCEGVEEKEWELFVKDTKDKNRNK